MFALLANEARTDSKSADYQHGPVSVVKWRAISCTWHWVHRRWENGCEKSGWVCERSKVPAKTEHWLYTRQRVTTYENFPLFSKTSWNLL